jgi:hypothetical protein
MSDQADARAREVAKWQCSSLERVPLLDGLHLYLLAMKPGPIGCPGVFRDSLLERLEREPGLREQSEPIHAFCRRLRAALHSSVPSKHELEQFVAEIRDLTGWDSEGRKNGRLFTVEEATRERLLADLSQRMAETSQDGVLVTLDQAAAVVGVSKRTLERLKARGRLPEPFRKGGRGEAGLWRWCDIRPALTAVAKRPLPFRFPTTPPVD